MTGPEHLREGKQLLALVDLNRNYGDRAMARVALAQAHFAAAQAIAYAAAQLSEHISWQEAGDA